MSNKVWPEDGKPASFDDLCLPIYEVLESGLMAGDEKVYSDGIEWNGLEIGQEEQVTCLLNSDTLSADQLRYSFESQGRDWRQELIGITLRLGIEQGRRMERTSTASDLRRVRLKMAADTLNDLVGKP